MNFKKIVAVLLCLGSIASMEAMGFARRLVLSPTTGTALTLAAGQSLINRKIQEQIEDYEKERLLEYSEEDKKYFYDAGSIDSFNALGKEAVKRRRAIIDDVLKEHGIDPQRVRMCPSQDCDLVYRLNREKRNILLYCFGPRFDKMGAFLAQQSDEDWQALRADNPNCSIVKNYLYERDFLRHLVGHEATHIRYNDDQKIGPKIFASILASGWTYRASRLLGCTRFKGLLGVFSVGLASLSGVIYSTRIEEKRADLESSQNPVVLCAGAQYFEEEGSLEEIAFSMKYLPFGSLIEKYYGNIENFVINYPHFSAFLLDPMHPACSVRAQYLREHAEKLIKEGK
ncbi:hypothetical protein K9K77_02340 [Candidatus Babeliales bacterium]|nr:hypothetical protein [Candidatus Babeliales bacterium]